MNQQTVQNVMHRQPVTVQCQTPLTQIIATLNNSQQAHLPVVNSANKLLGMVSQIDCQKALLIGAYHCDQPIKVNDIMAKSFTSLTVDEDLSEVAMKTQTAPENLFPVITAGKLVGIVKRVDLLLHLQNDLAHCSITR